MVSLERGERGADGGALCCDERGEDGLCEFDWQVHAAWGDGAPAVALRSVACEHIWLALSTVGRRRALGGVTRRSIGELLDPGLVGEEAPDWVVFVVV